MEETSIAIFGGGCFWCTEAIFDQLKGVVKVESGYSGGHIEHPTYAQVCDGITGHAEVIKIEYEPSIISFQDLIEIHLYTHDPTTLNRQGADWGTQYRSVIFYRSEEEKQLIQTVIEKAQPDFKYKIVTKIEALSSYYPAENYHQNYFRFNSENPYCQAVIPPKLKKLREKYAHAIK